MIKGDTIIEKGSEFISMAQKVCTMEEVRLGYRKMRIKYGDAAHIMCAYRLNNPKGPYNRNGADDGEYGAGRTLLKYLKEQEVTGVCIYIVRYILWCTKAGTLQIPDYTTSSSSNFRLTQ